MHAEYEDVTPDFLRQQLKLMADVTMPEEVAAKFDLFAGLIAMIKMLQPEGYKETVPAFVFHLVKE